MSLDISELRQDQYLLQLLGSLSEANRDLERQLAQRTLELEQAKAQLQAKVQEHQETEQALRLNEENLRRIFEYSNDAIFVIDPEADRILEANPKAEEHLGYSRQELLSSVRVSEIHPHELDKMMTFSQTVLEQGQGWTDELMCRSKSGLKQPSEISASVIEYEGRRCILALIRNIADRCRAEEALRQSEIRFRTLVENAADMILVIDQAGKIVDVNQRTCEKLGYSREELLNLSITDIDAKYTPTEIAQLRQQFQVGVPTMLETVHQRKDGITFPVEASICLFESGDQLLEMSLVRDITERKQAEQAIARLAEIGELAAMIVHEVRNPLTTVLMGLSVFQKMELPESIQQRLELALEEAERLKRLLNEILLYAKPQSLRSAELEVNELVQNILEAVQNIPIAGRRQLQICSTMPIARILGDRDKLKQVFINLIRNAYEAVEDGEIITWRVDCGRFPCQVSISVVNGGDPIPPEVIAKLGTPFFTTKPSGNGLGLAIVKQIVEAHGGELAIKSEAEAGTTVTIHLPLVQPLCS
ncbi:MAG: hypothetical protein Kow00121_26170 [Elainellaceae cyanobacterium]